MDDPADDPMDGSLLEHVQLDGPERLTREAQAILIKTARGIDKSGPGENGENITRLWRFLAQAGSFTSSSAAESSILRWLLKDMNGPSSTDAEILRRFPLSWQILNTIFQRMPLSSLAKALADRKFLLVLRQTLKEIAKPVEVPRPTPPPSRKRKRHDIPFSAKALRTSEMCLRCAESVFVALDTLVARVQAAAESTVTNERLGAEHIKSLFCSPATEAMEVAAPLLSLCLLALESPVQGPESSRTDWASIMESVWDLRLRGPYDASEVAVHLFPTAAKVIGRAERIPYEELSPFSDIPIVAARTKNAWSAALQSFLHRNLILPAKAAFLNRKDLSVIEQAMDVASSIAQVSSPVMYLLVIDAPNIIADTTPRADNDAWLQEIFRLVEQPLVQLEPAKASYTITGILQEAIERLSRHAIAVSDLRAVCRRYALRENSTNWKLLNWLAGFEADTFIEPEGAALLEETCKRLNNANTEDVDERECMDRLVGCLADGFAKARDLTGFFKLWARQISACVELQKDHEMFQPIWFEPDIFDCGSGRRMVEENMNAQQIVALVDWLSDRKNLSVEAMYIVLDTLCRNISQSETRNAIGTNVCDAILHNWIADSEISKIFPLRFRILSMAINWTSLDDRGRIWREVKDGFSIVLRARDLGSNDCFEATRAIFGLWQLMAADPVSGDEVVAQALAVLDRLGKELSACSKEDRKSWQPKRTGIRPCSLSHNNPIGWVGSYLDWLLQDAPWILRLASKSPDILAHIVEGIFHLIKPDGSDDDAAKLESVLVALQSGEGTQTSQAVAACMFEHEIAILKSLNDNWLNPCVLVIFESILRTPDECLTRINRETILSFFFEHIDGKVQRTKFTTPDQWRTVLRLIVTLMKRPTFYKGAKFDDLILLADCIGQSLAPGFEHSTDISAITGITTLFQEVAACTIRQMAVNMDLWGNKYFEDVSKWLEHIQISHLAAPQMHVRLSLLRALVSVISEPAIGNLTSVVFDPELATKRMVWIIRNALEDYAEAPEVDWDPSQPVLEMYALLAAIDAASVLDIQTVKKGLAGLPIKKVEKASQYAITNGLVRGWKLRIFLIRYFADELVDARPSDFASLFDAAYLERPRFGDGRIPPDAVHADHYDDIITECVDAVAANLDFEQKLAYLGELVAVLKRTEPARERQGRVDRSARNSRRIEAARRDIQAQFQGQLLAISRVIKRLKGAPVNFDKGKKFDLATAQTALVDRLPSVKSTPEFQQLTNIVISLLDADSSSMTQWNIENTMSIVAKLVSSHESEFFSERESQWFKIVCEIVEVCIRQHRIRLEGRYHLLVNVLQALLDHACHEGYPRVRKPAEYVTRLITSVCEPTARAASRTQQDNTLESATDTAKRWAGRYMYLVLMKYVQLLLERDLSRAVRSALEPAMHSILAISSPEVLRIMNDGMDESGRAIMRELYTEYNEFGKWKGV